MPAHQVSPVGVSSLKVPRNERSARVGSWTPILEAAAARVVTLYEQDVARSPQVSPIVSLLIVRILRVGDTRLWVPAGAILGVALLNKSLIALVIGAVIVALLSLGPRDLLRSRWFAAISRLFFRSMTVRPPTRRPGSRPR